MFSHRGSEKVGTLEREVTSVSTASLWDWLASWRDPSNCFSEGTELCEGLSYLPCKALKAWRHRCLPCVQTSPVWSSLCYKLGFCEAPGISCHFKYLLPLALENVIFKLKSSHGQAKNKDPERLSFSVFPCLSCVSSWLTFLTLLWPNSWVPQRNCWSNGVELFENNAETCLYGPSYID